MLGAGLLPSLRQGGQRHGRHIERSTSADLAVFDLRPERVLLGNAEQGVLAHLPTVPGHQCVALGRRLLRARHVGLCGLAPRLSVRRQRQGAFGGGLPLVCTSGSHRWLLFWCLWRHTVRHCPCMPHQQMARRCRTLAFPSIGASGHHDIADIQGSDVAPIIPMDGSTVAYLSACLTLIVVATVVPSCVSVVTVTISPPRTSVSAHVWPS